MTHPKEENNYPKALAISTGIMAAFLALSFFIAIGTFKPVDAGMGGMVVNYGTSVEGMGTDYTSIEEPSADPNANEQAPDKVVVEEPTPQTSTAQSSDKEIVTQSTEDAVSVKTKTTTKNSTTPVATATEKEPAKPAINQNALYKGKSNKGTGGGDGTGTTAGNQGSVNGDPLANNYGEGGSGFGGTPIALRKFTNLVIPQDDGQQRGRIAVRIKINKSGIVIEATPGVKGTTLSDRVLWQKCKDAVMGARLTQSDSAPDVQIGVVVFNFKVK